MSYFAGVPDPTAPSASYPASRSAPASFVDRTPSKDDVRRIRLSCSRGMRIIAPATLKGWLPYGRIEVGQGPAEYIGHPNPFSLTGEWGIYFVTISTGAWRYLSFRIGENFRPSYEGYDYVSLGAHIFGLPRAEIEPLLVEIIG